MPSGHTNFLGNGIGHSYGWMAQALCLKYWETQNFQGNLLPVKMCTELSLIQMAGVGAEASRVQ